MAVTGILIVVALILALQIDKVFSPSQPQGLSTDHDPAADKQGELDGLEKNLADLKQRLETLQAAVRKTESEAEIKAQIARIEERILSLTTHAKGSDEDLTSDSNIEEVKAKAAEIIRLREEIRRCEEEITHLSKSAADAAHRMQELEKQVREAEAAVAAARAKNRSLRLIRELSDTTKEPIIVDASGRILKIMRFDHPGTITASSLAEFEKIIRRFRKHDQYFVIYFRPDGAIRFEELRNTVKSAGFEVGYDAIPQDALLSLGKKEEP